MIILIICATGFINIFLFDLAQVWNRNKLKYFFSIIGYLSIFSVIIFLLISIKIPPQPLFAIYFKSFFSFLFFSLLFYSLFIEIGIKAPYSKDNTGRKALDRGTYSIIRHPGLLWFTFMSLSLILIYKNFFFTTVMLSMVTMDFILVLIEDYYIFPKLFVNYQEYKKKVPLIIPNLFTFTRSKYSEKKDA